MVANVTHSLPGLARIASFLATEKPARRAVGPAFVVLLAEICIGAGQVAVGGRSSLAAAVLTEAALIAILTVGILQGGRAVGHSRWLPLLSLRQLTVFGLLIFTGEALIQAALSPWAWDGWERARAVAAGGLLTLIAWVSLTWMLWSTDLLKGAGSSIQSARIAPYTVLAMCAILATFSAVFTAIMFSQAAQRAVERETASLIERVTRLRAAAQRISRLDIVARTAPERRPEMAELLGRDGPQLAKEGEEVVRHLSSRPAIASEGVRTEFAIISALLAGQIAENVAPQRAWPHDVAPLADHLYAMTEQLVAALRVMAQREAAENDRAGWLNAAALVLALVLMGFIIIRPIVRFIATQIATEARTRKELKDSLARLRSYQEALDHQFIFAATDRIGRIIDVNAQFCRISGYSREELIGKTHRILNSGQHPPGFFADMWRTIAAGGTWTGEICNKAKDGRLYWVSTVVFPIFNAAGVIEQYAAIRTDVTETKLALQLLEEAVAAVPEGFVIYDAEDRLIACNEAYRAMYAPSAPAIKHGATFREILEYGLAAGQYPAAGETEAERAAWLEERLTAHQLPITDVRQQLPDGRWLQIRERTTRSGYKVGFQTDVTDIQLQAETLDTILQNFPGGIVLIDRDLRVRATNANYRRLLDVPDSLFAAGPPSIDAIFRWNAARGEYGPGEIEDHVRLRMERILAAEPHVYERRRRDGTVLEIRGAPLPGGGFVTIYLDITERVAIEAAARAHAEQFRSLFQLAPVGVALSDAESGRLTLVSESLAALTGYAAGELVGRPIQQLLAPEHHRLLATDIASPEVLRFGPIEVEYIAKDKRRVPALLSGIQVSDAEGRPMRLTIAQDITERRETEQRLWRLANLDSLTGLANRLLFNERLEATLKTAQRNGEPFAVGLIDLDRFKEINDTYGHDQGDLLLKVVAERIASVVRESDTVARLGGDEFAFILRAVDGVVSLHRPLQNMLAAMEEPIEIGGSPRRCAMSIGVTVYPADAATTVELLKNADIALYRAKGAGRGRVEFFSQDMRASVERGTRLKAEVEAALAGQQFEIFYQPIFALSEHRVTAVEALLRWRHPRLGLVSPEAFRDVFEDAKLAAAIGETVVAMVGRDLETLARRGTTLPRIALNATTADFATGTFLSRIEALQMRTGLQARDITIEITEDMFLGRSAGTTLETIKALAAAGFEIALDDFGTGYASLSHLRQFPVQRLKIDRSFVADMEHDPSDAAIVRAIAFLAHSLDLKVTAEGVDSDGQVEMLRLLGVDSLQGYLLSKPMPLTQLASLLDGERRSLASTA